MFFQRLMDNRCKFVSDLVKLFLRAPRLREVCKERGVSCHGAKALILATLADCLSLAVRGEGFWMLSVNAEFL